MHAINKLIAMKFPKQKFIGTGLTYDDVLLVPSYSECLPNQVDLTTKFSRNINLNIPILGINTGRLGFLAIVAKDLIEESVELVINGDFTIQ